MSAFIDNLLTELAEQDQSSKPPLDQWNPEHVGEVDICIKADGRWIHEGGEITRLPLVNLLASVLIKEGDTYYLKTPVEKMAITVEDLPFIAHVEAIETKDGFQKIWLRLNTNKLVLLGKESPLVMQGSQQEPQPAVNLGAGLFARITRSAWYQLVDVAQQKNNQYIVQSDGVDFILQEN